MPQHVSFHAVSCIFIFILILCFIGNCTADPITFDGTFETLTTDDINDVPWSVDLYESWTSTIPPAVYITDNLSHSGTQAAMLDSGMPTGGTTAANYAEWVLDSQPGLRANVSLWYYLNVTDGIPYTFNYIEFDSGNTYLLETEDEWVYLEAFNVDMSDRLSAIAIVESDLITTGRSLLCIDDFTIEYTESELPDGSCGGLTNGNFETGTLANWSDVSVPPGVPTVIEDAAYEGTYGLELDSGDSGLAGVGQEIDFTDVESMYLYYKVDYCALSGEAPGVFYVGTMEEGPMAYVSIEDETNWTLLPISTGGLSGVNTFVVTAIFMPFEPEEPGLGQGIVYIDNITCIRPYDVATNCTLVNGDFEDPRDDFLYGWTIDAASCALWVETPMAPEGSYGVASFWGNPLYNGMDSPYITLSQEVNFTGKTNFSFAYATFFDPAGNLSAFVDDDIIFYTESTTGVYPEPTWAFADINITNYTGSHTIKIIMTSTDTEEFSSSDILIDNVCLSSPEVPTEDYVSIESTSVGQDYVDLYCYATNPCTAYIMYGRDPDRYTMKSPNFSVTAAGAFTIRVSQAILPDTIYDLKIYGDFEV